MGQLCHNDAHRGSSLTRWFPIHFNFPLPTALRIRSGNSLKGVNQPKQFQRQTDGAFKMTLNMLAKPVMQQQSLFSLNMRNITELFPGFAPGDFAVIYGSPSVLSLTSLLCIRAQLPVQLGGLSSSVIFIDGGNTFRLYHVSRLAQIHHMDPQQVLKRIYLSRAFTAYQMTALIMEHLKDAVEKYNAKIVVISDVAALFLDKDISEEEAKSVYNQVIAYLQNFAREKQIILIATCPTHQNSSRSSYLQALTCTRANVVLSLKQTTYDREISLEKHSRFMLGSAEFPSDNLTLTDFM